MQIGILTGGGDAPGLNAAIRAVARCAFADGASVLGVRNGWAGLLDTGDVVPLRPEDVSGILVRGGTILGTSRVNPLAHAGAMETVASNLKRLGIDALVAMGGDDTLSVAASLAERGVPVVGVPKTVDNDLQATEYCIGFDSAVAIVTEAVDRLHTTAASHHRVMVVEAMGREAGWVTLKRHQQGEAYSIIAVAEGAEVEGLPAPSMSGETLDAFGHVRLSRRGIGERLGRLGLLDDAGDVRQDVDPAELLDDPGGGRDAFLGLGHVMDGGEPAQRRIRVLQLGKGLLDRG